MSSIFLTPASISFLTQAILALTISVYLVRRLRQQPNPQLTLLAGFFCLATIFIGLMFLDAALSPYYRLHAVYAENAILALAMVFMVQFAYRFPHQYPHHNWETRISLLVSLGYLAWETYFMGHRFYLLFREQTVSYRPHLAAYAMAAILVLAPLAFIRQTIAADPRQVSWLRKLWQPEGKAARGARNFVGVFGILFILGITNVFLIFQLPHTVYNALMSIGILVALWLFATNYINFIPGGVSVQAKLSILSLALFLALLGSVGWLIAPPYIATFQPNLTDRQTLRFTPNEVGGYEIAEVAFSFESNLGERLDVTIYDMYRNHKIDFAFPFYGKIYDEIYAVNSGAISVGEPFWQPDMQGKGANTPAIFPLMIDLDPDPVTGGGLHARVDSENGRLILTWNQMPALHRPAAVFTFQAVLYQDGIFEITYNDLPLPFLFDPDATPSANPWVRGVVPGEGESLHTGQSILPEAYDPDQLAIIENYQSAFRRYLHTFMLPLTGIVLGGSLALLIGLPVLMRYSVIRPLETLTRGVQQMDSGNLTVKLPIQNQDEIGFLTLSFNKMAAHLQDLVTSLENRFRQFFEYEPDYIYMVSPEGVILDVNPAALRVLGYSYSELVGQPLTTIYAPEAQETVAQLFDKWETHGELINEEIVIISKDGDRRTVLLSSGMVRDRDGNLLHSLSIQRDITDRVRAEQATLELAAIEERRRLASDLHDSMTQSLHSLILSTETAQHLHRDNQPEKLTASLAMLEESARQALQEMRLLLYELQVTSDEEVDLMNFLEARLGAVERRMGIETELIIENTGVIPKAWEREIFFIIIEALNNTLKHSRADFVSINIQGTPYELTVTVTDNGIGFLPNQTPSNGMGLQNIQDRAARLGGALLIDSVPRQGTTIQLHMALGEAILKR